MKFGLVGSCHRPRSCVTRSLLGTARITTHHTVLTINSILVEVTASKAIDSTDTNASKRVCQRLSIAAEMANTRFAGAYCPGRLAHMPSAFGKSRTLDDPMGRTASGVIDDGASARPTLSVDASQRRLKQRRQMLILQTANYAAGDIIVWIYAYAGTTSIVIPSMFFSLWHRPDSILCCAVRIEFRR